MNWVIIALIVLSLIGSMLWMMPSPRQRMQAQMRQKAMTSGMRVQMVKLKCPRATGEAEPEERDMIAYRLPRHNLSQSERHSFNAWQLFKLNTLATAGLPEGWSWGRGEGQQDRNLTLILQVLGDLPEGSFSLESSADSVSLYWTEHGGEAFVSSIKDLLNQLIEAKV